MTGLGSLSMVSSIRVIAFFTIGLSCVSIPSRSEEIRVAVASNFRHVARALGEKFELGTGHRLTLIFGSTGKHYAQIHHGAPFDVFLAADSRRPELLEDEGLAVAGSRFTYALGRMALWSPRSGYVDGSGKVLRDGDFQHLAMANPKLAPYGLAARQILGNLGLWEELQKRIVRGENIGQAFHFVGSGNAELGFVALAQVRSLDRDLRGSFWEVPGDLHESIGQQAVLLHDKPSARSFVAFLKSEPSRRLIKGAGYGLPERSDF